MLCSCGPGEASQMSAEVATLVVARRLHEQLVHGPRINEIDTDSAQKAP